MMAANRTAIRKQSAIKIQTRAFFTSLLDLVFPPRCISCRILGRRICDTCASRIPWIDSGQCARCGLPLEAGRFHACIDSPLRFIRSAAVFSGPMRKALHALKYYSDRPLAEDLVRLAHGHWTPPTWEFDCLVPVPLGPLRERARGYNQSRLLADALSRITGIPIAPNSLERVRETRTQVGLSLGARKENMANAFRASGVGGRTVLLIDDVCTTGSTLLSCAAALLQAGCNEVGALTLARAVLPASQQSFAAGGQP
jgi:ComF family protein